MNTLQKSISICFALTMAQNLFAQQSAFSIQPNMSSAFVSTDATRPFIITWVITNNTSHATAITPPPWFNTTNGDRTNDSRDDLLVAPNTKVLSSTCDQSIRPGEQCTIETGTIGLGLYQNFSLSLAVCGFNNQLCAQATENNRVGVIVTTDPIPEGTWKTLASVSQDTFPEFITIDPVHYQFAVGIINRNYLPLVIRCQTDNPDLCTVPFKGLIDHDFTTMTNLSFDAQGNLYGLFIQSAEATPRKNTSYVMKLPKDNDTWSVFGNAMEGTALGLDTSNPESLFLSAQTIKPLDPTHSAGVAKALDLSGNSLYTQTFTGSTNFGNIVNDGQGNLFVSGPETNPDESVQSHSKVWEWNPIDQTFTPIPMPNNIPLITDLVSDGKGTLYLSGLDIFSQGQVWKYTVASQTFENTKIDASYITTLNYSPYGYLLAGGVNNTSYTGTIWYYQNNTWVDLQLPESTNVVSIASNANNDIFATGFTTHNQAAVWLYNSIDTPKG